MIKTVLFTFLFLSSAFSQIALDRFNKSTLVVLGAEVGVDLPFESVKYIPGGDYKTMGADPLLGTMFHLGISMPVSADRSTHLEFNLLFPRSVSEVEWSEKYPINNEGDFEATALTEKNTISGIGVNSRLFKYLQHDKRTYFVSVGLGLTSVNRTRNISSPGADNIYNSIYTPDGTAESAFNYNLDAGAGMLFRLSSSKFVRFGYRTAYFSLPEQSFYGALVPYSSTGYLVTHHFTANLLLRL